MPACASDGSGFPVKIDRVLVRGALGLLALTLFLAVFSLQMTDLTLRVQTMVYATYMFISGVAILVLVEILHLARKEISKNCAS